MGWLVLVELKIGDSLVVESVKDPAIIFLFCKK